MSIALGYILAIAGAALVYLVYDGFGRALEFAVNRRRASGGGLVDSDIPDPEPLLRLSVVIPAYNEAGEIEAKVSNLLEQDYPRDRLRVIVVDDGSSDATCDIVQNLIDSGHPITLVKTPGRYGKTRAQNLAVAHADGDVLVLTDCGSHLEPGTLRRLVAPLSNPRVGCTTAELYFRRSEDTGVGEAQGYYWNYELKLRRLQSQLGTLATATGSLMALRRELWVELDPAFGDDCVIPLNVVERGFLVVHVDKAVSWDENYATGQSEYRARVRMTVRNWGGTWHKSRVLNPLQFGWTSICLFIHKILRWLTPLFLLAIVLGSVIIAASGGSMLPLLAVSVGLVVAAVALVSILNERQIPVLRVLGTFILVNFAFAQGVARATFGGRIRVYEKADQSTG